MCDCLIPTVFQLVIEIIDDTLDDVPACHIVYPSFWIEVIEQVAQSLAILADINYLLKLYVYVIDTRQEVVA